MKFKALIFTLSIYTLSVSCYYNAAERNRIVFKDNEKVVKNALLKMEQLMWKLPKSEFNINYDIKGDSITINDGPGRQDSVKYFTYKGLSVFTKNERREFIYIAKYLKRNFITAGYFNYNSKVCFFVYREKPENTFDDSRDIAFLKEADTDIIKSECKILDKVDQLMLVAPIGAKIYDNYMLLDDKKK